MLLPIFTPLPFMSDGPPPPKPLESKIERGHPNNLVDKNGTIWRKYPKGGVSIQEQDIRRRKMARLGAE
jgi:hypothetical protein